MKLVQIALLGASVGALRAPVARSVASRRGAARAATLEPEIKSASAKKQVGIVGAGLAGMICAMDLLDAGHDVELFELRPFVGGKVSSWIDKEGNHIEMGLHVFFGCYYNLFGIMERTGSYDLLRMKEHIHTFVNDGGDLGALDFRFPVGAPVSGLQAFARTEQLGWGDKAVNALRLGTSPIVRALVDFDGGMDQRPASVTIFERF
ncbi:oxidoreductase [Aureococcus anophagefferens]|nr:oxidoreductase [Aureococcus anophagefferens]